MAYVIVGPTLNSSPLKLALNYTVIDLNVSSPGKGTLKLFSCYSGGGGTVIKVKIFRDDGTNYIYVGESQTINLVGGLDADIPVNVPGIATGDLIGVFASSGAGIDYDNLVGSQVYKAGDITSNSLKTSWSSGNFTGRFNGKVFTRILPL